MADGITVTVLGNKAIVDNIGNASVAILAKMQILLDETGQMALDRANSLTPVDTGYLQSRNQVDVQPESVTVSNDADYAIYVELGHHSRSGSWVPAQPFLTPAFDEAGSWLKDQLGSF